MSEASSILLNECIPQWNLSYRISQENSSIYNEYDDYVLNFNQDYENLTSADPLIGDDEGCFAPMGNEAYTKFAQFERTVNGYLLCIVGCIGILGNCINLGVLSHKEMRGSCFNQLLIGKRI